MKRALLLLVCLSALAPRVRGETPEAQRAEEELREERRRRVAATGDRVQRVLYEAAEAARSAQLSYYQREREVETLIIVEESLIHRDRRYVAEGKPAALARKLAAEQAQALADRRLRRWGKWAGRRYPVQVRQAELWTVDSVSAELYRNERFRREVCRQALELADRMERAAERARKPPRKR
ncbi:MAG: hypothetical protein FJ291_08180 [Planctomycetes bacterium]|nr:hypothetical protein [Planctomycetota bacterium]